MESELFVGEAADLLEYAGPKHLFGSHSFTAGLVATIADQVVIDQVQHLRCRVEYLGDLLEFLPDVVTSCNGKKAHLSGLFLPHLCPPVVIELNKFSELRGKL